MTTTLPLHRQELCRLPAGAIPAQRTASPLRVLPAAPVRRRQRWPSAVSAIAAGLTVGAAAVGAVGAAPAEASPATPRDHVANVSVPGRILTAFNDGTWQVGVDVAPGTYTSAGAAGTDCYHARRTASTGGDILSSAVSRGPATVVLTEDDGWFETSGCATWNRIG
jgi:hypothetical protein